MSASPLVPHGLAHRLVEEGGTFAVTGATGWFGRVALDLLAGVLGPAAFRERVRAYASRPREVEVTDVGTVAVAPLSDLRPADTLLHFAFLTRRTCRRRSSTASCGRTSRSPRRCSRPSPRVGSAGSW